MMQARVNIETLFATTEAVLQTENAGWLQKMRKALAEIYDNKKEKDTNDNSKRLDDVAPAIQPRLIARVPKQPSANELEPVVETEPDGSPTIQPVNVDAPQPLATDAIALPLMTIQPRKRLKTQQ